MSKGTEMPKMQEMLMVFDLFKNPFWQSERRFHRLNLIAVFYPHLFITALMTSATKEVLAVKLKVIFPFHLV